LDRTPEDLAREPHAGLVLELVALREIQEDEEVTMSYGDDWQKAWRDFSIDWFPSRNDGAHKYTPASALNKRVEWLRTKEELENEAYPDNVMTVCFIGSRRVPMKTSKDGAKKFRWVYYQGIFADADFSFPCDILEREKGVDLEAAYDRKDSVFPLDVRYTALVQWDDGEESMLVENIPRPAIRFFDVPYSSDLSLRTVFRHEIHLPDDMVPSAWRDIAK